MATVLAALLLEMPLTFWQHCLMMLHLPATAAQLLHPPSAARASVDSAVPDYNLAQEMAAVMGLSDCEGDVADLEVMLSINEEIDGADGPAGVEGPGVAFRDATTMSLCLCYQPLQPLSTLVVPFESCQVGARGALCHRFVKVSLSLCNLRCGVFGGKSNDVWAVLARVDPALDPAWQPIIAYFNPATQSPTLLCPLLGLAGLGAAHGA